MPKFKIRPRRYADQLDAIFDVLSHAKDNGVEIDVGRNPNSRYALLAWAHAEIQRLREKCGEPPPSAGRRKIIPGPRPVAEAKPIELEEG